MRPLLAYSRRGCRSILSNNNVGGRPLRPKPEFANRIRLTVNYRTNAVRKTIMNTTKYAVGFSVAAVLGVCTMAPVSAAPVLSNAAALRSAIENPITEVRYVRRGVARRSVARAAVATGVGLAAAASYRYAAGYPSYGYGTSYNYGYP